MTRNTDIVRRALKERALRMLAARPYTRARLAEKLAQPRVRRRAYGSRGTKSGSGPNGHGQDATKVGPSQEDILAVLDDLERVGLLDDAAYATAFAEQSLRTKPESKSRLAARLRSRGVPADIAQNTAAEAVGDEDAFDIARRALDRVWYRYERLDRDSALRRAGGFLLRRGFSEHVAWTVVKERV